MSLTRDTRVAASLSLGPSWGGVFSPCARGVSLFLCGLCGLKEESRRGEWLLVALPSPVAETLRLVHIPTFCGLPCGLSGLFCGLTLGSTGLSAAKRPTISALWS